MKPGTQNISKGAGASNNTGGHFAPPKYNKIQL